MNYAVQQPASAAFFPNNPDAAGQVFAYHFDAEGRSTADETLAAWTWRSYLATDIRARMTIERNAALPAAARESLLAPGHTCHLDLDGSWFFGDLPDLRHDYSMEARGLGHFRFALDGKLLIGCCKQPLRSIDHVRQLVERGARSFRTPCDVVEAIIGHSLEGLAGDLVRIGEELDEIEERVVRDHWHGERQQLNESRRKLVLIHREMATVASLFRRLEGQHHLDLPEAVADMASRLSNRAASLNQDGEQLQAQARLLQDELMAKLTAQSNQLLYTLSLLTAVLLPISTISGLFGMNVGGIPMGENGTGFWAISGIAAVVAGLVLLVLRRIGGSGM